MIAAGSAPEIIQVAYEAINLMGGGIDWAALAPVCEMLGITDIERMIKLIRFILHSERS